MELSEKNINWAYILKDHKPIDYNNWIIGDRAREGANLIFLNLLNSEELEIWKEAILYQDQREDPGQAELVTYFAIQLLNYIKADRNIVIPAAMMHDLGWYKTDVKKWKELLESGKTEGEEVRRPHQNRGVFLAGKILGKLNYPEEYNFSIADIIGDHDTRLLPTTVEGQVVRDADLIWRVTYPCLRISMMSKNYEEVLAKFENTCINLRGHLGLGPIALEIAKIELVNTIEYRFSQDVPNIIGILRNKGYKSWR